MEIAADLVM